MKTKLFLRVLTTGLCLAMLECLQAGSGSDANFGIGKTASADRVNLGDEFALPIFLDCSSNLDLVATGTNGAIVYFTTSAYGGCSSPLKLSSSPPSGSIFPVGTTVVTTTAADNCGHSTNCTFTVTVAKKTYPPIVLDCSSNLDLVATGTNGAIVYFTTSAYGGCSSPLNLSSSPPSGSIFPVGTTTAADSCGDSTNCTFTVTVSKKTYPPIVLDCSSNLDLVATGTNGAIVYFTTSAYGGCSSPLNLSSSPPSGSILPVGTTVVTTTAADSCGDSTNCTFTVTVSKKTYPPIVLDCSSNLDLVATGTNGAVVYFTTSAYGGCSSPLNLSSLPPSGSIFPVGTTVVTTTAADSCGDSTNCTFEVTVINPNNFTGVAEVKGGIRLNWPAGIGLVLQQSSSLGAGGWTTVTNTPTITNGENQLSLPPINRQGFYRLVNP